MHVRDSQGFEVQYLAGDTGTLYAKYDVSDAATGRYDGNVTVRMTYGCFGDSKTEIWGEQGLNGITIVNGATTEPQITWA